MPTIDDLLLPRFVSQHGLVTLDDVRNVGGDRHTVHRRLSSARWERVDHGVYRLLGWPVTWHSRLLAPILSAGGLAIASHHAAAALYGLPTFGRGVAELTVPRGTEFRRDGVRVHTSTDLERCTRRSVDDIPTTDPSRTLLDLGRSVSPSRLWRSVEAARRAGLTDWSRLTSTLARHARPGRPGIRALRSVILANAHIEEITDSELEHLFLSLVRETDLPEPVLHYEVICDGRFVAEVDYAYPLKKVAIELDGSVHLLPEVRERDLVRQNDLQLAGWSLLRFTWQRLHKAPDRVVSEIWGALGTRSAAVS